MKILIAEDDEASRRVLQLTLTEAGHEVVTTQNALEQLKLLQEIVPICSFCNDVRDDQYYWQQLDTYIGKHSEVQFGHSTCPTCYESIIKTRLEERSRNRAAK